MGKKDGIFRYADRVDKLLMFFGTLGSIGDGLQIPLMMFVLSDVINDYGNLNSGISIRSVDKYALRLLYVAILVGLSAFIEGLCWARTAERQTSRMRLEYLKSVLKQEVGFFDSQAADSSTTFQVVTTISSDSNTIQVTIGEKVFTPQNLFLQLVRLPRLHVVLLLLPYICVLTFMAAHFGCYTIHLNVHHTGTWIWKDDDGRGNEDDRILHSCWRNCRTGNFFNQDGLLLCCRASNP